MKRTLYACFLFAAMTSSQAESFLWRENGSAPLPAWLELSAAMRETQFAQKSFTVKPSEDGRDVLVTLFFEDNEESGFLRATWAGVGQPIRLCDNLLEGIGLPNRRTLRVTKEEAAGGGVLTLQCGAARLPVTRIIWQRVESKPLLVASESSGTVAGVDGSGRAWNVEELDGFPAGENPDAWRGDVITASLQDRPVRVEAGTVFVGTLAETPTLGRITVRVTGLPPMGTVSVVINGKDAGLLPLEVPDLTDPGYAITSEGEVTYTGWRTAAVLVPAGLLVAGDNSIELVPSHSAPLAVRELRLQLKYPPEPLIGPVAPQR